ncbi:MAG: GNAT family N-acetyltransferase [Hamadaea sp.]|uniref:GNAT family N-acetyltransferase n=1 Tax=Hamadaea sp. TaxID=2024425 RepID=UPI00179D956A|nr:GNAT family N-acetyltransferase [Hamadaea sp.]NUT19819.1 GNAT family N-acetyltransferase [Hamadaea sp.]
MEIIEVRPAAPADLPAAARLRWQWLLEYDETPEGTEAEFVEYFTTWAQTATQHTCHVAVRGDTIVGMAWLAVTDRVPSAQSFVRRSGDLQSVYVVAAERNRGIAGRLVDAVLDQARSLGLRHVTVHSSSKAISVYEGRGFEMVRKLMLHEGVRS